ncbi:MAG TPA: hypothetical protein HA302_05030 [Thermococcaceae archaeon]|uniref:Uncharacterized protein n=1 Tax=Thermococcus sibiricus TaxID=172049 RepID=A0A101EKT1_9EURY|nr:hypothetical protein [Thermococcus sibiricus]KUK16740.1 MAG: Uncharacterized protein XD54_1967 [Thermococcus sibiricus]KUK27961.1 MAG: Uncharacterized protein XD61_1490 [Thermococcus sp. 40_45]HII67359.1 hypothetical protein [Thermococcaceae archaeon]
MKRTLLALLLFIPLVNAQSITITPYGDGYATVEIEMPVDDYTTQVTSSLLGDHYEDIFVIDENGNPLEYSINGNEITITVQNSQIVKITYSTPDLMNKEGLIWTLSLKSEAPVDVILPEEADLVDMSDSPLEIHGNKITMPAGEVQISFILQDLEDQKTVQDIATNTDKDLTKIILPLGGLLALLVLGIALWKR